MPKITFSALNDWALVNTETGEVKDPESIIEFKAKLEDAEAAKNKRSNFAVLYPLQFYALVNAVGSKKMEVIGYIIKHMGADNVLIATAKEIAKEINVSKNTVDRTLQALEKANLIHRRPGVIMLNPKLINRKHKAGEYRLMLKYDTIGDDKGGLAENNQPPESDKEPEK